MRFFLCECDCGKEKAFRIYDLLNGHAKSCGCYRKEAPVIHNTKHGYSHKRLYKTWLNMLNRCRNPKNKRWNDYGGRGIKVCSEWIEFIPFMNWALSSGYNDDLTIDRIDADGNYESNNCRWETGEKQANNKRCNIVIEYDGESLTLAEWSRKLKIDYSALLWRISNGWSTDKAFNTRSFRHSSDKGEVRC